MHSEVRRTTCNAVLRVGAERRDIVLHLTTTNGPHTLSAPSPTPEVSLARATYGQPQPWPF